MRNRDKHTPDNSSFIIPEVINMLDELQLDDDTDHAEKPSDTAKAAGPQDSGEDWGELLYDETRPQREEMSAGSEKNGNGNFNGSSNKISNKNSHSDGRNHGSHGNGEGLDEHDLELLSLIKDKDRLRKLLAAEHVSKVPSAAESQSGQPEGTQGGANGRHSESKSDSGGSHHTADGGQQDEAQSNRPASKKEAAARHSSANNSSEQQGKGKGQGKGHSHSQEEEACKELIPKHIERFLKKLETDAGYKISFDIVVREMTFGEKKTALFFMNGLVKDTVLTDVLTRLTYLQPEAMSSDALHAFLDHYVPAVQVKPVDDWDDMLLEVMAGASAFYIDGEQTALIIDAKMFPSRGPEEPSLERVVRGARDGFVETLLVNVSLVRRRLRDPHLRYEILRIGERTKTDVCIAYIDDIADTELVESIRDKIKQVQLDGLPLADKQLEEATVKRGWNPYPLVRYSERPDVVAAHLLEGAVAVFVDTSPSVMTLPTTFSDLMQHAEENRQTPFIGTYLRWVRFIGIWASLFLLPIWFLFVLQPDLKPAALDFIGPTKTGKIPLVLQFLLAELGVDMMRMASVHTPTPLATAMSLVAAILIGDIAVSTGLFVNEVILYMAIAAIGMFATPSYELGLANRIVRLLLIVCVAVFHVPGLVVATTVVLLTLALERSFNRPYMWPFIPFDAKAMLNIIVRTPVLYNRTRPNLLRPKQRDKMPRT